VTSELKKRINNDFITAMKARDTRKKDALQLLRSAIKQREVDQRIDPTDQDVLEILTAQLKQRRVSLEQYQAANRNDLAEQEQFEIEVMSDYLPEPLTKADIDQAIAEAIQHVDAKEIKDMGKVMARLKPNMQGRADLGEVSQLIKKRLTAS
jgi:uncharacterized protein